MEMAKQRPEDIRNVAFAGHGGCGKTTLVDELLFAAGANSRIGSVREGTSLSDTAADEIDGQSSIDMSFLHCTHRETLIHLLDTPGRSDFVAQTISALGAAESVVIPIDAYSGIQVNTRRAWKMAREEGKAVVFVVTKLDMENVDLPRLLTSIRDTFGPRCTPFYLPDTTGGTISRLYSVLTPPDDAPDSVGEHHEPLVESIVESDEELMMRYLEGEDVTEDVAGQAGVAIASGELVPVMCFAQKGSLGVTELLDLLVDSCPSAATVKSVQVVEMQEQEEGDPIPQIVEAELEPNTFLAQVVKVVVDEHKGRMAVMKVYSGSTVAGAVFHNATTGKSGKFGKLFQFFGIKHEDIDGAGAGDLFAAAKIDELSAGDTVSDGTWTRPIKPLRFPNPMVALAITPKTRSDEARISLVLQRYAVEDRAFRAAVDKQTKEMVVYGMSELHLNVLLARMAQRQNVHVDTKLPKISYRETITRSVSDFHRHKKQSGGAGEFAEVHFRMRPYREGETDFSFVDGLHGDNVRRQFVPSVEKGCRAIMEDGILTGSPVIWLEVEFHDGKDHPVDGKDVAFQKAAKECFRKCFLAASPVLLEPMVDLEVTFPTAFAGEISQYLNSHRGKIQGMEQLEEEQVIRAVVPFAEIQTFSSDLRSMTQGQGNYTMDFASYEQMPNQVQQQVIEAHKRARETS